MSSVECVHKAGGNVETVPSQWVPAPAEQSPADQRHAAAAHVYTWTCPEAGNFHPSHTLPSRVPLIAPAALCADTAARPSVEPYAPHRTFTHLTSLTHGAETPLGAAPLRLTDTTASPVRRASSLTRLPTKPLPPKMTSFGWPLAPPPPACK